MSNDLQSMAALEARADATGMPVLVHALSRLLEKCVTVRIKVQTEHRAFSGYLTSIGPWLSMAPNPGGVSIVFLDGNTRRMLIAAKEELEELDLSKRDDKGDYLLRWRTSGTLIKVQISGL